MKDRVPLALAILFAVSVVWGLAFVAIKVLLDALHPLDLTLWRFLAAGLAFGLVLLGLAARRPHELRFSRRDLLRLLVLGVFAVPGYHLSLNYGEDHTPAGVAAILVGTGPVWIALLAALVLREPLRARRSIGIAVAFAGTAVIVVGGEGGDLGLEPSRDFVLGALTVLLAPLSWAIYSVLAKPMLRRHSNLALTASLMLLGTLLLLPTAALSPSGARVPELSAANWGWLLFLGIAASFLGYAGWNFGIHHMEAAKAGSFVYFVPVFAVLWSWLLLEEPITAAIVLGGGLTVVGVVVAASAPKAKPIEIPVAVPAPEAPPK